MTGTLPGVECARRRRIHYTVGGSDSPTTSGSGFTRRSSFCLYTSNHESQLITSSSSSSSMQRSMAKHDENANLGKVAREAKERLDERLRAQRKSETKRGQERSRIMEGRNSPSNQERLRGKEIENRTKTSTTQERLKGINGRYMVLGMLQTEVFGLKKSGLKRLSWAKLGGEGLEPEECSVCLDQFNVGETLVHLPCAHRFHSMCLVPWLENNAQCPCCRMELLS